MDGADRGQGKKGSTMRFRKALVTAAAALTTLGMVAASPATSFGAPRPPAVASSGLTAVQTADRFLGVAYTWKTSWYGHSHPSIGKRDTAYTAPRLDQILRSVTIAPDSGANSESWTPRGEKVVTTTGLKDGVKSLRVKVDIGVLFNGKGSSTFSVTALVHVGVRDGKWKAVGAALPIGFGPKRYCTDDPLATTHCRIFPQGSS
jgi:hypothetical protein